MAGEPSQTQLVVGIEERDAPANLLFICFNPLRFRCGGAAVSYLPTSYQFGLWRVFCYKLCAGKEIFFSYVHLFG